MSFYRALLAALAAMVIAFPVFADDSTDSSTTQGSDTSMQSTDNSSNASSSTSTDPQAAKVNINTASAKDLMKVKGLNASKARAIIAYRKKHGNFKSIDELANVKGFKKLNQDTMSNITNQLTVE